MSPMRRAIIASVAVAAIGSAEGAVALTCAIEPDAAERAIVAGWPDVDPYEYVFIATILAIEPEMGDAASRGEVLTIRIDAVLRGDLALATDELFNPPLGMSGWIGFEPGRQYLIAAGPNWNGDDGRLSTSLCTPNEEITSPDRFAELVALASDPRMPDTAAEREASPLGGAGLVAVIGASTLAAAMLCTRRRHVFVHD